MQSLIGLITSADPAVRNQSLDAFAAKANAQQLLAACAELDAFRRQAENLYERVRTLFFLAHIHRYHLPVKLADQAPPRPSSPNDQPALIPFHGFELLLHRRFEEAIDTFLADQQTQGSSDGLCSALAAAYHRLAFQTLADQVRRSVRTVRGNQWMFRMGHPADQPLRIRPELLQRSADGTFPILLEQTPVRMDLTHSAWSDIFFLGMDFPEGAKVINISVDLGVHGRDAAPRPPVNASLRVIDEPVLRLTSVDLGATADLSALSDVFDFAKDYLGLLKAAVIAAGIVPPGIEGSGQSLAELLAQIVGPGRGLEIVSNVNDIPKGSRLAVSTNLLGSLISVCMRATGQTTGDDSGTGFQPVSGASSPSSQHGQDARATGRMPVPLKGLTGPLSEPDRRLVLARALLGEWLGGSGGGWQDSGGVWPGIKLITGVPSGEGDPEFGISRGRLMPVHHVFSRDQIPESARKALMDSLVVVHGGMAQNVGPILEMVTEKYLLRSRAEWAGRQDALSVLDEVISALKRGDIKALGAATTRNFREPLQAIIPWASTYFTEQLIAKCEAEFGGDFWGFWMLGGMSGGGMGFIFAPHRKLEAQARLQQIMLETKRELSASLPFAMDPVVFDYAINENGTFATLLTDDDALMPPGYYALVLPKLLRTDRSELPASRRPELDKFGAACRTKPELRGMVQTLFDALLPRGKSGKSDGASLHELLEQNGFDRAQHEQIRADLKEGRIGLAQNRLRADTRIEDVKDEDVARLDGGAGQLAVVAQAPSPVASGTGAPACAPEVSLFTPFDKDRPASITQRNLPHWRQDGCTYFVTFRLADAMPKDVLERWRTEKAEYLKRLPQPVSEAALEEATALFTAKFEEESDRGFGSCFLRKTAGADEVERCLRHFDGQRYALGSYVVMPNHVHVLVRPLGEHSLSEITQGWKSVSAHTFKKLGLSDGVVWQDESFDHIVRDGQQLERFGRYIAENPVKARLKDSDFRLGCGTGGRQAGAPAALDTGGGACATSPASAASAKALALGEAALRNGELAVVTLAAGAGSRWTGGAGTCKALHPYAKLGGRHRTFIETHLAKSRKAGRTYGATIPHVFTTSYLTQGPTAEFLGRMQRYGYDGPLHLSQGKSVGLRMIPTVRDLRFQWEEMPQQVLDVQQQKVRESLRSALMNWAKTTGEGSDYTDNVPLQCLHPVGHFYELPNLLRNGVLAKLLTERPQLRWLMLHNIDTLGASPDAALLGQHIQSGACLTFEVITRRLEDRGGGLARVNGRPRLVEGLAMPREEDEFRLSFYNSMTTWIDLDQILAVMGLTREDVLAAGSGSVASGTGAPACVSPAGASPADSAVQQAGAPVELNPGEGAGATTAAAAQEKITAAIRALAAKLPTYVTVKDVKKRWGHGQEDVFPVAQFEKLWSDLTALPEINTQFVVVPRLRGQQLKDQAQLDGWLRDGSAAYVESLCEWA
jgi:REP element-mobilizing transposase RayT